ncbi:MAG: ribose-phosphate diphosphokinase [Nanoarchaeota archaeon]
MLIVSFPDSAPLARAIAGKCRASFALLALHPFPDGESLVIIPRVKGKHIVFIAHLHHPNAKILPLLFALATAKELGAKSITLVVPYLPYMRQDKRFHEGECVSQQVFAKLLSHYLDKLITIDPHLHRVKKLSQVYRIKTKCLSANDLVASFIKTHFPSAFIIGPDSESDQWATKVARKARLGSSILLKTRFSSESVSLSHLKRELKGKAVVIVDDIISSGNTMLEAVREAKRHQAKKVVCIGVHGLFAKDADKRLQKHAAVITTNTIPHRTNRIDITDLLAEAIADA